MNDNSALPRLCFSYLRFSRAEQAKGSSTKRQIDLRENYCQRHNLILDDSRHYEDKGVSGFHGKNLVEGHFAMFLDLVKSGQIPVGSVLLIESMDRFSRDQIRSARDRLEEILEANIEIHTLSPERVYDKNSLNDPFALIGLIFEFAKAHEYSAQLSRRLSVAWSNKREQAKLHKKPLTKRPPAWLKVVDGKFVIIPERAKVVELIYQLCADGLGINLIVKELVRRKIPAFNKTWVESFVVKILSGEAAIGHHVPCRKDPVTKKKVPTEKILNLFPPVISEVLNSRAKTAMRQRKNKGGRVDVKDGPIHPFMNLLKSPSGVNLRVKYRRVYPRGDSPQMLPFLHDRDNSGNSYPLLEFEQMMLNWLTQFEPAPTKKKSNSEIGKLEDEIAKLDYKIQTLTECVEKDEKWESFLALLRTAETEREQKTRLLAELRAIQPLEQGHTILLAQLYQLWNIDGAVSGPEFGSVPLIDIEKAKREKQEALLEVRGTLRRMIKEIQVTIGRENWSCKKKSLQVSVTFRDGTVREFLHKP